METCSKHYRALAAQYNLELSPAAEARHNRVFTDALRRVSAEEAHLAANRACAKK